MLAMLDQGGRQREMDRRWGVSCCPPGTPSFSGFTCSQVLSTHLDRMPESAKPKTFAAWHALFRRYGWNTGDYGGNARADFKQFMAATQSSLNMVLLSLANSRAIAILCRSAVITR